MKEIVEHLKRGSAGTSRTRAALTLPTQRRVLFKAATTLSSPTAAPLYRALLNVQVFVAGATGNTGRRVVQQLRAAGYDVRAGCRVSESVARGARAYHVADDTGTSYSCWTHSRGHLLRRAANRKHCPLN